MPTGFLVIADISGYTSFLSHAELEPAAGHLRTLLDTLITHTRPPLIVSRLEGDAVISYAPGESIPAGPTMMAMIEDTYVAFRRALDQLVFNVSCNCNACTFVPDLDLKFFVHYGSFLLQPLGRRYVELVGRDVNLIHRLTKNHVVEQTGFTAYVVYTEQALQQLEMESLSSDWPVVIETYDHIGDVVARAENMHVIWERKQREAPLVVTVDDALVRITETIPVPQLPLWDFLNAPEHWNLFLAAADQADRSGDTAAYGCAEAANLARHKIVHWDPPRQVTFESERPLGLRGWTTLHLEPAGAETQLTVLVGRAMGKGGARRMALDTAYRRTELRRITTGLDGLDRENMASAI